MKKFIKYAVLIAGILLLPQAANASFSDVLAGDEYYDEINYVVENGGISDASEFRPNDQISKAELIKMLLGNAGYTPDDEDIHANYYNDFERDAWFAAYANQAVDVGLLNEGGDFDGGDLLDKGEAATYIVKWLGLPTPQYISEEDLQIELKDVVHHNPQAPYIKEALEAEIMEPKNNDFFGVGEKVTRAYAAKLVYETDLYSQRDEYTIYFNAQVDNSIPLIDVLTDVYVRLTEDLYDTALDHDDLLYTAIEEMVNSAGDQYTVFSEPVQTVGFTQLLDGEYEGVGIYIEVLEDDFLYITSFLANSPAEDAGLKANDRILMVDGQSVEGLNSNETAALIKGEANSWVTITVERKGETLDFKVQRKSIEVSYIESDLVDNNIAYIKISFFGDDTDNDFAETVEEFFTNNHEAEGILLDLRNNPGGYVDTAINIASEFVPIDEIVTSTKYNNVQYQYSSKGPGELSEYPVVILVDEQTASASEILSATLQEYELATVVGTVTTGKGSVQEIIYYNDGSSLKYTVAHWLTPYGNDLNEIGVIPDLEIEQDMDLLVEGFDTQYEKAVDLLQSMIRN